jgi:L-fuconolactonase
MSFDVDIDAHVHVWTRSTDPQPWINPDTMSLVDRDFTMDDLATTLDAHSVRAALVVQSSNSIAETRRLLAGASDRVAGVVGWLDVSASVSEQLAVLHEQPGSKLVGIRHLAHIDPDSGWLGRTDVTRGLGELGHVGLCFDLVLRWHQLCLAETVVTGLPHVQFVLDHLGGPPTGEAELDVWERSLRALAAHSNVSAKLSGIAGTLGRLDWTVDMCRRAIEVGLEAFRPDRLMYGSDWPLVELAGGSARWQRAVAAILADISPSERGSIFGATAARVYRLGTR